jgi:catechol 2,3-dioxygenase-like lactoylglutathione lyase family enzyme
VAEVGVRPVQAPSISRITAGIVKGQLATSGGCSFDGCQSMRSSCRGWSLTAGQTIVCGMATVSVRYIVHDVDEAIGFYCGELGFQEVMHPAPTFAMLSHGDLRLVLSAPGGGPGGGQAMPDGTVPEPGGWNRFSLEVSDIDATVDRLRAAGARFRNEIVSGVGGKQILVDDPSGNPVELFEPTRDEARLDRPSG